MVTQSIGKVSFDSFKVGGLNSERRLDVFNLSQQWTRGLRKKRENFHIIIITYVIISLFHFHNYKISLLQEAKKLFTVKPSSRILICHAQLISKFKNAPHINLIKFNLIYLLVSYD